MKKEKIILKLAIIGIACILGYFILHNVILKDMAKKNKTTKSSYQLEEIEQENICKENTDCLSIPSTLYKVSADIDDNNLLEILEKINADNKNLYEKMKSSNLEKDECQDFREKYKHSISTTSLPRFYVDENYFSISVNRSEVNICTNGLEKENIETYIYDFNEHKVLSNKEIQSKFNVTDNEIIKNINQMIVENNIHDSLISSLDGYNYNMYIDEEAQLWVNIRLNEDTKITTAIKDKKVK